MRTPKFDWEAHKDQLLELKLVQKKSLTEINKTIFEKTGIKYTNARLSQVFSGWKRNIGQELVEAVQEMKDTINAN